MPAALPPLPALPWGAPFTAGFDGTPVGTVVAYAGRISSGESGSGEIGFADVAALGWLPCDGRDLAKAEYPELYAVLGNLYGGSSEGETFNLPDYRGYFMRGVDEDKVRDPDAREPPDGGDSVADPGSTQSFALQSHTHEYNAANYVTTGTGDKGTYAMPGQPEQTSGPTATNEAGVTVETSPNETRPVNIYVQYLIKFAYLARTGRGWPPRRPVRLS